MRVHTEMTYICSYCGKEFEEDELDLCEEHEALEKLLGECRFWGSNRTELKNVTFDTYPETVFYLWTPSSKHAEAANEWLESCGFEGISDITSNADMYFYDTRTDSWHSVHKVGEYLNGIKSLL